MSEKKKKDIPQEQPKPEESTPETPVEETPQAPEVEETFTVTRQQMEQFEETTSISGWPQSTITTASAPPRRRRAFMPMPSWKR